MEKETLIKFMTNLIAFAKVYRGVVKKVADKEYNTHNAMVHIGISLRVG